MCNRYTHCNCLTFAKVCLCLISYQFQGRPRSRPRRADAFQDKNGYVKNSNFLLWNHHCSVVINLYGIIIVQQGSIFMESSLFSSYQSLWNHHGSVGINPYGIIIVWNHHCSVGINLRGSLGSTQFTSKSRVTTYTYWGLSIVQQGLILQTLNYLLVHLHINKCIVQKPNLCQNSQIISA